MRFPTLLVLPVLFLSFAALTACGEKASAAMNDATRLAAEAADAAKKLPAFAAASATVADLTKSLSGITDGATAAKAKAQLTALVDSLQQQVGALGGLDKLTASLGNGDLMKGVTAQVTKLMGNADIAGSVGPVLEKLKALLAGK